jgi:hypothetical protein
MKNLFVNLVTRQDVEAIRPMLDILARADIGGDTLATWETASRYDFFDMATGQNIYIVSGIFSYIFDWKTIEMIGKIEHDENGNGRRYWINISSVRYNAEA